MADPILKFPPEQKGNPPAKPRIRIAAEPRRRLMAGMRRYRRLLLLVVLPLVALMAGLTFYTTQVNEQRTENVTNNETRTTNEITQNQPQEAPSTASSAQPEKQAPQEAPPKEKSSKPRTFAEIYQKTGKTLEGFNDITAGDDNGR